MKEKYLKKFIASWMAIIILIIFNGQIPIFADEVIPIINIGTFNNVYAAPEGERFSIPGLSIELEGQELEAGMFTVHITGTDSTFSRTILGGKSEDVTNDAAGRVLFVSDECFGSTTLYYSAYLKDFDGIENYTITNRVVHLTVEVTEEGGVYMAQINCENPVISIAYTPPTDEWIENSWEYEVDGDPGEKYVLLKNYDGDETDLTIYGKVIVSGNAYPVYLDLERNHETGKYDSFLSGNQRVRHVTFVSVDDTRVRTILPDQANGLFHGMAALEGVNYNNGFTNGLKDISGMFEGCTALQSGHFSGLDLSSCEKAEDVFRGCTALSSVNLAGADFRSLKDSSGMFAGCVNLSDIDLSQASWGNVLADTERMFDGDGKLTSVTVSSDFTAGSSCGDMFGVTGETRLLIKGTPSDTFLSRVCPALKDSNRYLGTISANAHVTLSGNTLEAGMFTVKLYRGSVSEENLITTATNDAGGLVSFGLVKVYDVTGPLTLIAVEDEKANVTVESRTLNKETDISLNSDGSISLGD